MLSCAGRGQNACGHSRCWATSLGDCQQHGQPFSNERCAATSRAGYSPWGCLLGNGALHERLFKWRAANRASRRRTRVVLQAEVANDDSPRPHDASVFACVAPWQYTGGKGMPWRARRHACSLRSTGSVANPRICRFPTQWRTRTVPRLPVSKVNEKEGGCHS